MFDWLHKKPKTSDPTEWITNDNYDLTRSVFFRVPNGPLRAAEIDADNEDVPSGIAILQAIFYAFHPGWTLHDLRISVWHHSATATLGRDSKVLFLLDLRSWHDGWMLTVCHHSSIAEPQLRGFLAETHHHIASLSHVQDVRWYPDFLLECGVFHDGDFERGLSLPDTFPG